MPRGDDSELCTPMPPPPSMAGILLGDDDDFGPLPVVAAAPVAAAFGQAGLALGDEDSGVDDLRAFSHVRTYSCDFDGEMDAWAGVRGAKPKVDHLPCPPVCPECSRTPVVAFYELDQAGVGQVYVCERCAPVLLRMGKTPPRSGGYMPKPKRERLDRARDKYQAQVDAGRVQPRSFDPAAEAGLIDMEEITGILQARLDAGEDKRRDHPDARQTLTAFAEEFASNPLVAYQAFQADYIKKQAAIIAGAENDVTIVEHTPGEELTDLVLSISSYEIKDMGNWSRAAFTGTAENGHRYWIGVGSGTANAQVLRQLRVEREYEDDTSFNRRWSFKLEPGQKVRLKRVRVRSQGEAKEITFLEKAEGKGSRNFIEIVESAS